MCCHLVENSMVGGSSVVWDKTGGVVVDNNYGTSSPFSKYLSFIINSHLGKMLAVLTYVDIKKTKLWG